MSDSLDAVVRFLRWLQCKLWLCGGQIERVRDKNGVEWLGLRCTATGTFHNPTKSQIELKGE